MTKVDLSPECMDALHDMQQHYDDYACILDCACECIIDFANTLDENANFSEAMSSLKNLRDLKKVISMFAVKGGEA